jgi:hypothetical protein
MRSDNAETIEQNAGIDFTSSSFVLQNLRLANKGLHSDPTSTIISRDFLSQSACLQMCFYLFLALKSFRRQPTILLFGAGHTGSLLVEYLVEFKLGPYLRIFQRGDNAAKQWRGENLISGCSLTTLLGGNKADIVIMCSGMSSFASICHSLLPFISKATFFISACFGLSRKRIFSSLKTANIFRTFQETREASQSSSSINARRSLAEDSRRIQGDDAVDDTVSDTADKGSLSIGGITGPALRVYSADLLVKRCPRLRNMVYLLENYYALRGMSHVTSRTESVHNIFGKIAVSINQHTLLEGENSGAKMLSEISPTPLQHLSQDVAISQRGVLDAATGTADHGTFSTPSTPTVDSNTQDRDRDLSGLSSALNLLQDGVVSQFQRQLSKSIAVTDIPLASDIHTDTDSGSSTYHFTVEHAQNLSRAQLTSSEDKEDLGSNACSNANCMGGGDVDVTFSPSLPVTAADPLLDMDFKAEDLLCISSIPSQYDANKRDLETLRFQTKAKILQTLDLAPKMLEPLGIPMHSDSFLLQTFGEDSQFHSSDNSSVSSDGEEGLKGSALDDLESERSAALLALLAEIDAEETRHPRR